MCVYACMCVCLYKTIHSNINVRIRSILAFVILPSFVILSKSHPFIQKFFKLSIYLKFLYLQKNVVAFATEVFLHCFGDHEIWWINRWKTKPSRIIKMLTYLAQHREDWMQSQDRVQLWLFVREDSRDVWVLWTKINFSSGQCMLWRPEPRIRAHWFCCHWCRIHPMLPEGQHPQQTGGFPDIWQRQHKLEGKSSNLIPYSLMPQGSYLLCLCSDQLCSINRRKKEMDILKKALYLTCASGPASKQVLPEV